MRELDPNRLSAAAGGVLRPAGLVAEPRLPHQAEAWQPQRAPNPHPFSNRTVSGAWSLGPVLPW